MKKARITDKFLDLMKKMTQLVNLLFPPLLLVLSGCALFGGGDGLERAENYTLRAPTEWKSHDKGESDSAYKTPSGHFVTVTGSCERHSNIDPVLLTQHKLLGFRNIEIKNQKPLKVQGQTGLLSAIRARLEKKRVYLHLFILPKDRCVYDFSLLGSQPASPQDLLEFLTFIQSFRTS